MWHGAYSGQKNKSSKLLLLRSPPLSKRTYCVAWRHAVTLCVCPPIRLYHVSTARRISIGGEGNALYPVLLLLLLLLLCDITLLGLHPTVRHKMYYLYDEKLTDRQRSLTHQSKQKKICNECAKGQLIRRDRWINTAASGVARMELMQQMYHGLLSVKRPATD